MRKLFTLLFAIPFMVLNVNAQSETAKQKVIQQTNVEYLQKFAVDAKTRFEANKQKALEMALEKGWVIREDKDGKLIELIGVTKDGNPLYYETYNADAAISTRANTLHNGGSLGLNIEGQGMTAHVWDGGLARSTHQEYDGAGGSNRFSIGDGTSTLHYHAAHVTGTIMASGVDPDAKGMAPQAYVIGYEWSNDVSEATTAAAGGMLVSNHSYGYGADAIPDDWFGQYGSDAVDWDGLMYNAPYYLMLVAAGNDGGDDVSNAAPLDGNSAYDKLNGHATSKNNLVVANAQDAIIEGGELVSVLINSGSSEGPTDDYRIKPDIAGNGTQLYSTYETADDAYNTISGTSMATPNVTGTLLLLQQHYNDLNASFMKAATLKGLALHTADDAGATGPDAVFGWGLMNGKAAAEAITNDGLESIIDERTLANGGSYTVDVIANGIDDLVASVSWTDPAGTVNSGTNSSTPALVNDLDVRITKSATTYFPYKLTSITTNGTGDNTVDPYEKIIVDNAVCGDTYTITVTHKGTLSASQDYSIIVTGIKEATVDAGIVDVSPSVTSCEYSNNTPIDITVANQGGSTVSSIDVAYEIRKSDNSLVGNGSYTIASIAACNTDVTTVYGDMSENGETYTVSVSIVLAGDENSANNNYSGSFSPLNVDLTTPGSAYSTSFEAGSLAEIGWSYEDANGDGGQAVWYIYTDPGFANTGDGFAIEFAGAGDLQSDDWMFSPCLYLKAGQTYEVSYYSTQIQDKGETMALYLGTDASSASMTTTIESTYTVPTTWTQRTPGSFTVPSDGVYYLGWHTYNMTDSYAPSIDDVTISNTSPATLPQVTTSAITNIGATTADGGGNVTNGGSSAVTERGIVYSTSINPTTSDNKIAAGTAGTGVFGGLTMSSLGATTTYYVRAYAINSAGTAYGANESFTTLTSMLFTSATTVQNNADVVNQGSTDQDILEIQIDMNGALSPLSATSFTLSTNGSTNAANDITSAKLYYTGTSGTFATGTQFGSTANNPDGSFTITGTQELSDGTNYFWLAYDISASAGDGNAIDAECSSITVGSVRTPDVTAPAGSRSVFVDPCATPIAVFPVNEGFEGGAIPSCWTFEGTDWTFQAGGQGGNPATAHTGSFNALFYHASSTPDVSKLVSPPLDLSSFVGASVSFWHTQPVWTPDQDELRVYYKTSAAGTWTLLAEYTADIPDWTQETISLPNLTSEYYIAFEATGAYGYGVGLDDIEIIGSSATMTYVSSTTTQTNTSDLIAGDLDMEIIGVEIVTSDFASPLDVTSFTFSTNGSTNAAGDIANAKLYYTGTSGAYNTASQFGTTQLSPSGSFTITGTQTLVEGTNYFWLAYDIDAGATNSNIVDAECTSLTVGTVKTPTVQAPAGSRTIVADPCATPISTFPFNEGFEGGATPSCWTFEGTDWTFQSGGHNGNPAGAHTGSFNALFYHASSTPDVSKLVLPPFDFSSYVSASLSFWHTQPVWTPDQDELRVYYKTSAAGAWTLLAEYTGDIPNWTQEIIPLTNLSSEYYIAFEATGAFGYGVSLDDIEITAIAPSMTYVSSTTTQTNTSDLLTGSNDEEMIGIEVVTSGLSSPLDASSFTFNTNGSTNAAGDITNAKLYYTGTNGTFSTASQYGTTSVGPNGSFVITGTQTLAEGTNYFWLAYDIGTGATATNVVDAECNSIIVGTAKTPTVQAPTGSRTIVVDPCAAAVSSFPYTQDFSSGALPQCWENIDNQGSGQIWAFDNPGSRAFNSTTGGTGFAILDSDFYGSGNSQNADLISPTFDFSSYPNVLLTFEHYFFEFTGSAGTLSYSVDNGVTWTELDSWTATTGNADVVSKQLSAEVGGYSAVKFKWNYTGSYGYYWAIDDISVEAYPACTAPTTQASGFSVDALNDTDVTISWVRGDGDNVIVLAKEFSSVDSDPFASFTYTANSVFGSGDEIGTSNFVVYNGTGTSVNVTNLKKGFDYHFAIYEYNNTGNCYLIPGLTGMATTPCYAINTFPATFDFDSWDVSSPEVACTSDGTVIFNDCWENIAGDDADWDVYNGATASATTGPTSDHTGGGNYLYLEASGCFNNTASFTTSEFDLTGYAEAQLVFYYHMYGANMGTLSVQASIDGGSTWSADLWSLTGDQGDSWQSATIPSTAYAGESSVKFKFTGITGTGFASDMAIDDISIHVSTVCTPPTTQATSFTEGTISDYDALVSWTRGNGDQVMVVASKGAPVSSTPFNGLAYTANTAFGLGDAIGAGEYVVYNGTGTSVSVTSLLPGTDYYFAIYEYNSASNCYLTPALTGSVLTTGLCSPCYAYGNMSFNTSITRVLFNTIDNATAKDTDALGNAFSDFTSLSTDVYTGTSYDLSVQVNTDGSFTLSTMVWIDWNQDCDFDDLNETYNLGTATDVVDGATTNSPLSIAVPVDAVPGITRMRVATIFGTTPPSVCDQSIDGEFEDYALNIIQEYDVNFSITDIGNSLPIAGAEVSVNSQTLVTDVSGNANLYLANGTYPYTVSTIGYFDASGSVIVNNGNLTENIQLTPYDPITFTATPADVTCNGSSDGTITVSNVAGGSGVGYQYSVDNGVTYQTSTTFADLAPNTYNVIVKDDEDTESTPVAIVVGQPDVVAYTVAVTDVNAGSDGEIQFNDLAGGSGSYLFTVDDGATWVLTNPVTGLTEADYTVNVKDDNDCMAVSQVVTVGATEQTITMFVQNSTDSQPVSGASIGINSTTLTTDVNGEATINLVHGDYLFTVSKSGFSDVSGLLTVAGSSFTETINLNPLDPVTFVATPTDVTCNGDTDGSITVTDVAGGTETGYQYSFDGGTTWQSTASISNLMPATYNVVVKDDDIGVSDPVPTTVGEPDVITFSTNVTGESYPGAADGIIEFVSVAGGTGAYEYSTDGGATWQASATASGLSAGDYTTMVQDANMCTSATQTTSVGINGYVVAFTVLDESAAAVEGATIDINSTSLTTDVNGEATIVLSNGDYTYTVTYAGYFDGNGTVTVADAGVAETVTIYPNLPITFNTDITNVTCYGGSDGQITFSDAAGGTNSGFEYSINGGATWQSTTLFNGLVANVYSAQVKDDSGNFSDLTSITVTEPDVVSYNVNATDVSVYGGNDGSIEFIDLAGGSGSYEFSTDGGATWSASNPVAGLVADTYTTQVRDVNGCVSAQSDVTVAQPAQPQYTVTFNVTDAGNAQVIEGASISINSTTLSTDASGVATIDLLDGTYSYMVSYTGYDNASGTITVAGGTVTENVAIYKSSNVLTFVVEDESATAIDGASIVINSSTITTDANGEATITLPNGAFAYTVSKAGYADGNGSVTMAGADVTENVTLYTTANTVTFNVTDGSNPLVGASVNVNSSTLITDGSGVATINLPDGTYAYAVTYTGYDEATGSVTVSGADITENVTLTESAYTVTFTVQDEGAVAVEGASISINSTTLTTDASGQATIDLLNGSYSYSVTKAGLADANGSVTVAGAAITENVTMYSTANTITFNITDADGGSAIEGAAVAINSVTLLSDASGVATINLPDGSYSYAVTKNGFESANGSVTLSGADVTENVALNAIIAITFNTSITDVTCFGGSDGAIEFTDVAGGSGSGYEYSINGGASWQTSAVVTGLTNGTFNALVKDGVGNVSEVQSVIITQPDQIAGFTVDVQDVTTFGGSDGSISITGVTGGSGVYEYSIDGGLTWQSSNVFESLSVGDYDIVIQDSFGCEVVGGTVTITEPGQDEHVVTFEVYVDGIGYEGATVTINSTTITTNADGLATINLLDGTYSYTVAVNGFDEVTGSVEVNGTNVTETINFVGVSGISADMIKVYPNPVSRTLTIELDGKYKVTLVNAIGELILSQKMEANGIIEVNNYADGLYLLRIEKNGQVVTKSVIINK